jgi:saccharopine dehydrogenase (NAD+, L-lysine forming)
MKSEDRSSRDRICIVGGYGHVGREIARLLAPNHPGRVTVAGRDAGKAADAAAEIGHGTTGVALDASRGLAPDDASLVIMCLDWEDPSFAADCFAKGIDYADISAKGPVLEMIRSLDMKAKRNGSTGLIGVGMSPGLTNLAAAHLIAGGERPETLDIFVVLGSGDDHGLAAVEWTLDHLDSEFDVVENGKPRRVRAQRETRTTEIPGRDTRYYGARFDFPEQRTLARTLALPTVSCWMTTMPPAAARLMRGATIAGASELSRRPRSRRALLWALTREARGNDDCGAIVVATGADGTERKAWFLSNGLSRLTAAATSLMVQPLIEGGLPEGVHHSDQVLDPTPIFDRLPDLVPGIEIVFPPPPR